MRVIISRYSLKLLSSTMPSGNKMSTVTEFVNTTVLYSEIFQMYTSKKKFLKSLHIYNCTSFPDTIRVEISYLKCN